MTDSMEQKIDKVTVMIGKLLSEDGGQNKPFKLHEVINLNRG